MLNVNAHISSLSFQMPKCNRNDAVMRIDAVLCNCVVISIPLFRCISAEYMKAVPRRRMKPASFCS